MADEEEQDEAAQAFEELRAEVTLMCRAVERLTAERMKVPDLPASRLCCVGATRRRAEPLADVERDRRHGARHDLVGTVRRYRCARRACELTMAGEDGGALA